MRKKFIGFIVCLTCCAAGSYAQEEYRPQERQQEEKRLPREVPNPEKTATKITNQMKKSLQLTDKQYKKIYKLNLKEQQALFGAMQQRPGGQRPSMEGRGPGGMRGGRPPMGGGDRPRPMRGEGGFERREGGPMMHKENAEAQKKAIETKEKKIKKILTSEQYEKWQAEQNEARQKALQERERAGERPEAAPRQP